METISIKQEARRLVDQLPENSTWDDLMHEIYNATICRKGSCRQRSGPNYQRRRGAQRVWTHQVNANVNTNVEVP